MRPLGMVVLEKGVDKKKTWRLKVRCNGNGASYVNDNRGNAPCGALLSINIDDIFVSNVTSSTIYYRIKCPCCGSITEIPNDKIPTYVKYVAKGKDEYKYDAQVAQAKKDNPNYEQDLYKSEDNPEEEEKPKISGKDYIELE